MLVLAGAHKPAVHNIQLHCPCQSAPLGPKIDVVQYVRNGNVGLLQLLLQLRDAAMGYDALQRSCQGDSMQLAHRPAVVQCRVRGVRYAGVQRASRRQSCSRGPSVEAVQHPVSNAELPRPPAPQLGGQHVSGRQVCNKQGKPCSGCLHWRDRRGSRCSAAHLAYKCHACNSSFCCHTLSCGSREGQRA